MREIYTGQKNSWLYFIEDKLSHPFLLYSVCIALAVLPPSFLSFFSFPFPSILLPSSLPSFSLISYSFLCVWMLGFHSIGNAENRKLIMQF